MRARAATPANAPGAVEEPTFEVIVLEETAAGEAPVFEVVETDLEGVVELLDDPDVDALELNGEAQLTYRPTDPDYPVQWEHSFTGLERAWDVSRGSGDITIAVLDSGVAPSWDLGSRLLPGVSFVGGNPLVDPLGHGSSVAAVAAAGHNQTAGAGVCPTCTILPVQVATPAGAVPWSAAAEGIVWAVDQGADVINMSFSSPGNSRAMSEAVEYALANGVTVVASAGNYGTSAPAYPAAVPGVIGVAGHSPSFGRYSWSSHGPWVDVAAPGCTLGFGGAARGSVCGTSFSAPWTAGVAGLLLAAEPSLSPAVVESTIETGTVGLAWVETGRVDAGAVLAALPRESHASGFTDVRAGSYYAAAVTWMVNEGITSGTSPHTFSPDAALTRGQLATFLWRAAGRPAGLGGGPSFDDVVPDAFYAEAVAWMVQMGITTGTGPGAFSPETVVTRGQLATFPVAGGREPGRGARRVRRRRPRLLLRRGRRLDGRARHHHRHHPTHVLSRGTRDPSPTGGLPVAGGGGAELTAPTRPVPTVSGPASRGRGARPRPPGPRSHRRCSPPGAAWSRPCGRRRSTAAAGPGGPSRWWPEPPAARRV